MLSINLSKNSTAWNAYWITAEILLLTAFISGFYGIVHKNNHFDDEIDLMQSENKDVDSDTLKNAVRSLIQTSFEARICGIVALVCTCISFIMVTVLARALHIATP